MLLPSAIHAHIGDWEYCIIGWRSNWSLIFSQYRCRFRSNLGFHILLKLLGLNQWFCIATGTMLPPEQQLPIDVVIDSGQQVWPSVHCDCFSGHFFPSIVYSLFFFKKINQIMQVVGTHWSGHKLSWQMLPWSSNFALWCHCRRGRQSPSVRKDFSGMWLGTFQNLAVPEITGLLA